MKYTDEQIAYIAEQVQNNTIKEVTVLFNEEFKATQFKNGHRPQTWVPIGTEVWRADGYLWVKFWDGKQPARKNWIQKHRLIWEEAYGEIPKGYQIMFADQDMHNLSLDNLILVTPAEKVIMSRNGLFYKNADETKVGITIARIINKASKLKQGGI